MSSCQTQTYTITRMLLQPCWVSFVLLSCSWKLSGGDTEVMQLWCLFRDWSLFYTTGNYINASESITLVFFLWRLSCWPGPVSVPNVSLPQSSQLQWKNPVDFLFRGTRAMLTSRLAHIFCHFWANLFSTERRLAGLHLKHAGGNPAESKASSWEAMIRSGSKVAAAMWSSNAPWNLQMIV